MELGADFKPVNGNHDQAQIRYQIDDKRIISEIWKEDANIDAAFAPSSVELSRAMKGAKKISMEFYPFYGYGPSSTAEFDLRGLAPHLSEIAKACGWPL